MSSGGSGVRPARAPGSRNRIHMDRQGLRTSTSSTTLRHRLLRCIEYVCWSAGVWAIAWVALVSWSSFRFQTRQAKRLELLRQVPAENRLARPGDPFGEISIPRLGLSAIIAEGVDEGTLRHAVGHFPDSSTPEAGGTVALAGHRETFFRALAHVRLHDLVKLETPQGKYQYEVVRTEVVGPEQVELVQSSPQSDLTLVTCFPFRYIGRAPERFIVQAVRIPTQ
jgi:sortase A